MRMAQTTDSRVGRHAIDKLKPWLGRGFENGHNNRGTFPDLVQKADDLPGVGYSWCASTVAWAIKQVIGYVPVQGSASVASWLYWGRAHLMRAANPRRGDLVCYSFGSADKVDHMGFVLKPIKIGSYVVLLTIEGNTGPKGATSDPGTGNDGLYRKIRTVKRSSVEFIRIPDRYLPGV